MHAKKMHNTLKMLVGYNWKLVTSRCNLIRNEQLAWNKCVNLEMEHNLKHKPPGTELLPTTWAPFHNFIASR